MAATWAAEHFNPDPPLAVGAEADFQVVQHLSENRLEKPAIKRRRDTTRIAGHGDENQQARVHGLQQVNNGGQIFKPEPWR